MGLSAGASPARPRRPWGPWWPWVKRLLTAAFFLLVAFFVFRYARRVDWHAVWDAITDTPPRVLVLAVLLSAATHTIYSCLDLLGRHYTGHRLPRRKVMQVTFISYAFNLNLGAAVGAIAFRIRMYSRLGLDSGTIARVISLSIVSNWVGYLVLAGLSFSLAPLELPPTWKLGSEGLRWLGGFLLLAAAAYIGLCVGARQRSYTVRGHELVLPPTRLVAAQLAIGCAHWLAMAAIVWTLLRGALPYPTVLNVLLIAAVAGVITHLPAGLGVLEAVFLALLSHRVPEPQLLAVLLSYRALYYIFPMLLALGLYLFVEAQARPAR